MKQLVAFFLLSLVMPVGAAEIKSVRPLWGDRVRAGHWVPVEIGLENRGAATELEVALEYHSDARTSRYYTKVALPSPSRKRVLLYAIAEGSENGAVPRVPGWRPEVKLDPLADNDGLLGVIANEEGGLGFLGSLSTVGRPVLDPTGFSGNYSAQGQLFVRYARPAELPDRWVGYDQLRLLVLLNASPRELDEARASALTKWVAAGGTLVVGGGSEWQRLRTSWLEALLPMETTGAKPIATSAALADRYGVGLRGDPLFITTGRVKSGATTYATEQGDALIVRRNYGAGNVIFLAFDPSRPPIAGWNGNPALWRDILKWADDRPRFIDPGAQRSVGQAVGRRGRMRFPGGPGDDYLSLVSAFAQDRKEMRAPPFEIIALFLLAYLIVLVPVNYFVLKRYDKREWAWVSTPVIVALFTLLSYGVGYSLKGGVLILTKLTIVQSHAGESVGRADTLFGLFSPGKRNYTLTTNDPDATMTDIATGETAAQRSYLRVNEDRGFRVEQAAINMWTMRMFQSHAAVKLGQGVRARFLPTNAGTVVELVNGTGHRFSEVFLVTGLGMARLGALGQQETKTAPLGNQTALQWSSAVRGAAIAQLGLLDQNGQFTGTGGAEAMFLGWTDDAFDTVNVAGERPEPTAQTLVAIRLPIEYTGKGMSIRRPGIPGVITEHKSRSPLTMGGNQFMPGQRADELTLPDGWVVYEIKLPYAGDDFVVRDLTVHATHSAGTASVYNFASHRWDPLLAETARILPGQQNPGHPLSPAGEYVLRPDNIVRIRLDAGSAKDLRISNVKADVVGNLSAK